MTISTIMRS